MAFMALNNVGLNRRIKIIPFVKEEAEESEESDVISKGDFRNLEDYDSGDCGDSNCGGDSENQDQDQEDEDDPYFEEYNAAHLQTVTPTLPPMPIMRVRSPQMFKDACEQVYQKWRHQLAAYIVQNKHMPCPVENPALFGSYIVSETMYGPLIPRPPNAVMLACKMHDDEYFLRHNIENPFDKIKREAAAFKVKVLVVGDAQIEYQLL